MSALEEWEASTPADAYNGPTSAEQGPESPRILTRHTLADIAAEGYRSKWLIEGFWPDGSYGMLAGAEKAFKSHLFALMALSVASGRPLLGRFKVRRQGPVVIFCGEGSRHLAHRRLRHLGQLFGLSAREVDALPILLVDEVAALSSHLFQESLLRHLDEVRPALVGLDPLYVYHGSSTEPGNVHAVGELLHRLAAPCIAAGAALTVVNHFSKIGAKVLSLSSITQAGGREWSDSWVLLMHRQAPQPFNGRFFLRMAVGSRQWGGWDWDLDVNLGRVNLSTFEYLDVPTIECRSPESVAPASPEEAVRRVVAEHEGELTKTKVAELAGGRRGDALTAVDKLLERGELVSRPVTKTDARGRRSSAEHIWTGTEPASPEGEAACLLCMELATDCRCSPTGATT